MSISVHPSFKLNKVSFSNKKELLLYAKSFNDDVFDFLDELFDDSRTIKVKTSGSTGAPKKVHIEKRYMLNSARATASHFQLTQATKALLCLNINYIAGKMMLVRALTQGWDLDIVDPSSTPLKGVHESYDFSAMVPLQVRNSISDLPKVKKLIIGGGVVSQDLMDELQKLETKCYATYGMTETVTHIATKKLNQINEIDSEPHYKTLPGIWVYQDKRNCLVIDAPYIADHTIITNDVVKLLSNTHFDWLGRYDNVINSGGVKLHPELIENKLAKVIKEDFFVAGIPDNILGEKLVLIIEGKGDVAKMMEKTASVLDKFEKPKEIFFVPLLLRTPTNKIQRTLTLKRLPHS